MALLYVYILRLMVRDRGQRDDGTKLGVRGCRRPERQPVERGLDEDSPACSRISERISPLAHRDRAQCDHGFSQGEKGEPVSRVPSGRSHGFR